MDVTEKVATAKFICGLTAFFDFPAFSGIRRGTPGTHGLHRKIGMMRRLLQVYPPGKNETELPFFSHNGNSPAFKSMKHTKGHLRGGSLEVKLTLCLSCGLISNVSPLDIETASPFSYLRRRCRFKCTCGGYSCKPRSIFSSLFIRACCGGVKWGFRFSNTPI